MAFRKIFKILFWLLVLFLALASYFFVGLQPKAEKIVWGVNFSQKHANNLGLDWREAYLAILDDLQAKNIKLLSHWDLLEPKKDEYFFNDLDWQIEKAQQRGVNLILVVGMKTGRWPECHIPKWAQSLSKEEQQKEVLELVKTIILRYRSSNAIKKWQAENEPFFPFGVCPWSDRNFVKKEVDLIKSLDERMRPVIVSDSGEFSSWIKPARLGDIVGITMYKRVWSKEIGKYVNFPLPPAFYWLKAQFVEKFFGKKVIVVELQAEPWGPKLLYDSPLEEQLKSMNLEQFRKNVEFAKKTGFDEFYFWGAEWWYWLEDKSIWQEVKSYMVANRT